jgi:copper oxidase (laccase) domain-containing protein
MSSVPYQPITGLPGGILAAFSTAADGSIAIGAGSDATSKHQQNAVAFMTRQGFVMPATKVHVTYSDHNSYTDITRVTTANAGTVIKADALFTTEAGITIYLPVADCIATLVYDPESSMLGVLHLGRHASVAGLIEQFAQEVANSTGSKPAGWHVWMSPSVLQAHDRMDYFTPPRPEEWDGFQREEADGIYIDTAGHNRKRFELLGVKPENIQASPIDTYDDERYFSHRAAVEQNDPSREGRMLLAAMLVEPSDLLH